MSHDVTCDIIRGVTHMTLADLAKQLNVSTRTIYRKCAQNGLSVSELRNGDGTISDESIALIGAMFDKVCDTNNETCHTDVTRQEQRKPQGMADCHALELELTAAKCRIDALERELELYKNLYTDEKRRADEWETRAAGAYTRIMNLLPESKKERQGLFTRLFRKGGTENTGKGGL